MNEDLRARIKTFLKIEFADVILEKITDGYELSAFKINPLTLVSIASGVLGELTSRNMAKALIYPRVLGTSLSTTFGSKMQKLCVTVLGASPSGVRGMDIEFTDQTNHKKTLLQLKAGPLTINSEDVEPIIAKMGSAWRLLKQNHAGDMPTFAIGVTYGSASHLGGHYRKIAASSVGGQESVPVYVGKDFWNRLTGNQSFYEELLEIFIETFAQENYSTLLSEAIENLAQEIERMYFDNGVFNPKKI